MQISCPNCGRKFRNATEKWFGASIECNACKHVFEVPLPDISAEQNPIPEKISGNNECASPQSEKYNKKLLFLYAAVLPALSWLVPVIAILNWGLVLLVPASMGASLLVPFLYFWFLKKRMTEAHHFATAMDYLFASPILAIVLFIIVFIVQMFFLKASSQHSSIILAFITIYGSIGWAVFCLILVVWMAAVTHIKYKQAMEKLECE